MDWIERILGISPDAGSGTLEFLIFVAPVIGFFLVHRVWLGRRKTRERDIRATNP